MLREKIKAVLLGKSSVTAPTPRKFTLKDWHIALKATKRALANKRAGILAAGIAYFATFAFFPLIAAAVAISSLTIGSGNLTAVTSSLETYLPADIASLLSTQLNQAIANQASSVFVAVFGIMLSIFSISGATQNVISALNATYSVEDVSSPVQLRLQSLRLMGIGIIAGVVIILLLLTNTPVLTAIGAPQWLAVTLSILRWPALVAIIALTLALVYRYGPNKHAPEWQWVSWGSLIASALWMLGTILFFIYARYFASFSDSYSTLTGIIVLMTWLNLSAYVTLLGAEVNNQLERQSVAVKAA